MEDIVKILFNNDDFVVNNGNIPIHNYETVFI